jgi:hypothetical protein
MFRARAYGRVFSNHIRRMVIKKKGFSNHVIMKGSARHVFSDHTAISFINRDCFLYFIHYMYFIILKGISPADEASSHTVTFTEHVSLY